MRLILPSTVVLGLSVLSSAAAQQPPPAPAVPARGEQTFPAQQRPLADPAVVENGKTLYGIHCRLCHGPDLRGGDMGGVNLLRSALVLKDQDGELILPVVTQGRFPQGSAPDAGAGARRRRRQGGRGLHPQRSGARSKAGRTAAGAAPRAEHRGRQRRPRPEVLRRELRELSLADGRPFGSGDAVPGADAAAERMGGRPRGLCPLRARRSRSPRDPAADPQARHGDGDHPRRPARRGSARAHRRLHRRSGPGRRHPAHLPT